LSFTTLTRLDTDGAKAATLVASKAMKELIDE